jgi:hypothetical protein
MIKTVWGAWLANAVVVAGFGMIMYRSWPRQDAACGEGADPAGEPGRSEDRRPASTADLAAALAKLLRSTGLPADEIREALRDAEEGRRPRARWIS